MKIHIACTILEIIKLFEFLNKTTNNDLKTKIKQNNKTKIHRFHHKIHIARWVFPPCSLSTKVAVHS